jgi:chromate transporter
VLGAVLQLGRGLVRTRAAGAIAAGSLVLALAAGRYAPGLLWLVLAAGGVAGAVVDRRSVLPRTAPPLVISRRAGAVAGLALLALLAGLPIVTDPGGYSGLFTTFFRAGALVFGGGHVVLPFLLGLIGPDRVPGRLFFAGYGAAQAVPGPLFTFAAFLGAVDRRTGGAAGALVALLGIFSPSFLLLAAAVPLWGALRALPRAGAALAGLGAAVVGLLAAAFVNPIAIGLLRDPRAAGLAAVAFGAVMLRAPAWAIVVAAAVAGAALQTIIPAHPSG